MVTFKSYNDWTFTGEIAEFYCGDGGQLMVVIVDERGMYSHFSAGRVMINA